MSDGGEFTLAHEEIGSGGYGTVCKATHNATGELVAAKRIKTSRMKLSAIEKEVRVREREKRVIAQPSSSPACLPAIAG